jgi:hypothetical protein
MFLVIASPFAKQFGSGKEIATKMTYIGKHSIKGFSKQN